MKYQNFKSDFDYAHCFYATDAGTTTQIPVPDHVRLTFFTEERAGRITVERNGDVMDGCSISDDGMTLMAHVPLSRIFIGAGELFCEVSRIEPDPDFPASERIETTPVRPGVTLWPGKSNIGTDVISETVIGFFIPGAVRYDNTQMLSEEQKATARANIGAGAESATVTYGDPKEKVNEVLDDFYAGRVHSIFLKTLQGTILPIKASQGYMFRTDQMVKISGKDCFTMYIMIYQNGVWGTQTFEEITPYGVSYVSQTLTDGRKLQARKNIDAATKAIEVPYGDIDAANAAVTAYKADPRRTLVIINYKSILTPAFVGLTDKPFIAGLITEAKQIRKLLFQNGEWTESLMYVPITAGMIADSAITTAKLANYSVTGQKLASHSVGTEKLAPGAVTLPKLSESVLNEFARTATIIVYGSDPKTTLDTYYKGVPQPALYIRLSNGLLVPANTNGVTAAGLYSYGNSVRKVLFDGAEWSDVEIQSDMIDTVHLQDNAVTEAKLAEALRVKINGTGGNAVLLDFSNAITISLTDEQVTDILGGSAVIAVRDSYRQTCMGTSDSGSKLYFRNYTVTVDSAKMTATIDDVIPNSIEQTFPTVEIGEDIQIKSSDSAEIFLKGDTTIASMPKESCVFYLNATGSTVLPEGLTYIFIGMDTPSDTTGGVTLEKGCYKVICRLERRGQAIVRYYYIFKL